MRLLNIAVLAGALAATPTFAAIIFDQGPGTGTYTGGWSNQTEGQNFADVVTLGSDSLVTGINFFTNQDSLGGTKFHIKILADDAGLPGAYLQSFDSDYTSFGFFANSNGIDVYQATFSFSPILFQAGVTYWVGLSGNGFDPGQGSLYPGPGDSEMAQFSGSTFVYMTGGVGDQAFQLVSDVAEAPEPGTMLIAGAGLTALAFFRRRK